MKTNIENFELYTKYLKEFKEQGCGLPELAALTSLIEHTIKSRSYFVYEYSDREFLRKYDVVVIFTISGDPIFGVYSENEEYESVLIIPNSTGVEVRGI